MAVQEGSAVGEGVAVDLAFKFCALAFDFCEVASTGRCRSLAQSKNNAGNFVRSFPQR